MAEQRVVGLGVKASHSLVSVKGAAPDGIPGSIRVLLTHPHKVIPPIGARIAYVRAGQSTLRQIQGQEIGRGLSCRVHVSDADQECIATDHGRFAKQSSWAG